MELGAGTKARNLNGGTPQGAAGSVPADGERVSCAPCSSSEGVAPAAVDTSMGLHTWRSAATWQRLSVSVSPAHVTVLPFCCSALTAHSNTCVTCGWVPRGATRWRVSIGSQ
jgi:hypothetical protein